MTNMRERIARAMYEATPFIETEGGYDEQSEVYKRMCLLLADAVLNTLLEPTPEMIESVESYCIGCCNMTDEHIREVFTDMIRAASA